ncbi:hypothetical protein K505DRAFT_344120 [Melanomma pulvis-pyrius CBS 109.77]|uniref:Uncharacterized protein n=1 Tax=Melanomma pulvis-pyrius CBS 109.77 TaxID=1314802 RepID=A0A6A6WQ79_9PLEO|nr:hypothetical protein K505DRAFT_344120 [Melanomma pulvis-pyrius CBS 109.77]
MFSFTIQFVMCMSCKLQPSRLWERHNTPRYILEEALGWTRVVLVSEFLEACWLVEDGEDEAVFGCEDRCKARAPLGTAENSPLGLKIDQGSVSSEYQDEQS